MTNKKENIDKVAFLQTIKAAITDPEFVHSAYYLGTPRKIKRVLNALIMSNLYGRIGSFKDRVNEELLYLLLLYIYHPEIFRDVFNYETNGKRGYFSLVTAYDITLQTKLGEDRFDERETIKQFNSNHYHNYIKKVSSAEAVFLLRKLFDVDQKFTGWKTSDHTSLGEDQKASWACFNGSAGTPKNLEDYLKFITDTSYSPTPGSQRATYAEMVNKIMNRETNLKELLKDSFFDHDLEEKLEKLLEVYFSEAGKFSANINENHIEEMVFSMIEVRNKIAYYSIKNSRDENEDFFSRGFRKSLDYRIVKLVEIGYYAQGDRWSYNKWIKRILLGGDSAFVRMIEDKSIKLLMNLNDVLSSRLYLCVDRGGQNHRISNALYDLFLKEERVNTNHGYDEVFLANEMREVSQHIYAIFKNNFIDQNISLFEEYENLSLKDIDPIYSEGDYYDEDSFLRLKGRLLTFILYQITCTENSWGSGVTMGAYDITGSKDLKGIKIDFTKYLTTSFTNKFEHYWHYLLISGGRVGEDGELKYSDQALFSTTESSLFIEFSFNNMEKLLKALPKKRISVQNKIVDLSQSADKDNLISFFNHICNLKNVGRDNILELSAE